MTDDLDMMMCAEDDQIVARIKELTQKMPKIDDPPSVLADVLDPVMGDPREFSESVSEYSGHLEVGELAYLYAKLGRNVFVRALLDGLEEEK